MCGSTDDGTWVTEMAVHAVLLCFVCQGHSFRALVGGQRHCGIEGSKWFEVFLHPKCQLRASGPGYRGTGGSEEFQEWASDHVSPWIDGRMKSDEIWKLWVFDFRVARYTTVIKTTPFFDRTKNYIYNGVLTSFLVTKASLSSRISGLERWPHGLMNLNLSEVCQFVLHPSA